jgi:hypothetical protein
MILRKVIQALSKKSSALNDNEALKHIPYRESKLTALLKQSLGGNAYCLMIACLSPSDLNYDENVNTIKYALKTNNIQNIPFKNMELPPAQ